MRPAKYPRQLFLGLLAFCGIVTLCDNYAYAHDRLYRRLSQSSRAQVSPTVDTRLNECPRFLTVVSFLGKPVCVHPCVGKKLADVTALLQQQGLTQASQLRVQRLTGFRVAQKSLHGQGLAIDIDAATNPYLIHERNEAELDAELTEVYERIAQFLLGRASIIPRLGTGCYRGETRRAYVARVYDALAQESKAMQNYFSLMQQGSRLQKYVRTSLGTQRARLPSTFLSVLRRDNTAKTASNVLIDQMRLRMAADWVVLTGDEGPPVVALDSTNLKQASNRTHILSPHLPVAVAPTSDNQEGDRPFDIKTRAYPGRSPLNGFLSLKKELVLALTDVGFRWGALDFGRQSGDLMHFDSPQSTCSESPSEKALPPAAASSDKQKRFLR
jgi:hypothetical protein